MKISSRSIKNHLLLRVRIDIKLILLSMTSDILKIPCFISMNLDKHDQNFQPINLIFFN